MAHAPPPPSPRTRPSRAGADGIPQKKHIAKDALIVGTGGEYVSEVFGKDRRTPVAVSGVD